MGIDTLNKTTSNKRSNLSQMTAEHDTYYLYMAHNLNYIYMAHNLTHSNPTDPTYQPS